MILFTKFLLLGRWWTDDGCMYSVPSLISVVWIVESVNSPMLTYILWYVCAIELILFLSSILLDPKCICVKYILIYSDPLPLTICSSQRLYLNTSLVASLRCAVVSPIAQGPQCLLFPIDRDLFPSHPLSGWLLVVVPFHLHFHPRCTDQNHFFYLLQSLTGVSMAPQHGCVQVWHVKGVVAMLDSRQTWTPYC